MGKGKNTFELTEGGVVKATASVVISDFAPIVEINEDEEGENAMWCTQSCSSVQKEKLKLSEDYDEDLREYTVPEIVITRNSTSKIPLKIIQGYDPWGFQDEDGIVEFSCSNADINIEIEEVNGDRKNQKKVKYGDEITIEISFKEKLDRGQKFSVNIKGKDGKNIEVAGKLNFSIVEKDVFMSEEGQIILDENDNLRKGPISSAMGSFDEVCYRVVDKQFSKVVKNSSLALKNYSGLTAYDRIKDYQSDGYIKHTKRFEQGKVWIRVNYDDVELKPKSYKKGKETVATDYIMPQIKSKIGYHIYYVIILDAYHVLTLLIDNRNLCEPKYKMLDQIKNRSWNKFKNLNNDLLEMVKNNYNYACEQAKRKDHNSSFQLWKLKRK